MNVVSRSNGRRYASALGLLALTLAAAGCGGSPAPEVAVVMTDHAFEPKQFSIQAGRRTTVTVDNQGSVEHNLRLPQLNLGSPEVAAGKTGKFEVTAPPGNYRLVCSVAGHEEAGMVGQMMVTRR